jgi:uracil-DNA glycosylase
MTRQERLWIAAMADDRTPALKALMEWYVEAGVDLAVDETPHDRFQPPPKAEPRAAPRTTPPTRRGGERHLPLRLMNCGACSKASTAAASSRPQAASSSPTASPARA